MANAGHGVGDRTRHRRSAIPISLQQVKSNALRRLSAHTGHATQCVDQANQ
jgi:hypothetical protein